MAYQRNYGYARNDRYNDNYRGRQEVRSFGNFREKKKHSGAKFHASSKNGNPVITAWNYSRRNGLVSVLIAPYKGTNSHDSKTGNTYENWMCTIEGKGIAPRHFPVLVNMRTHKATIDEGFGWVVNPGAPNGGYCGSFSKNTR